MSSRLEHDPQQAIGVLLRLNGPARRAGLAEPVIYDLLRQRLMTAGISCAEGDESAGCALGVEVHLEDDGLCTFTLEFFRVRQFLGEEFSRSTRGGAWRLTLLAHATDGEAIKEHLSLMVGEFVRQYMEAN